MHRECFESRMEHFKGHENVGGKCHQVEIYSPISHLQQLPRKDFLDWIVLIKLQEISSIQIQARYLNHIPLRDLNSCPISDTVVCYCLRISSVSPRLARQSFSGKAASPHAHC
jgi:hypothetical protein